MSGRTQRTTKGTTTARAPGAPAGVAFTGAARRAMGADARDEAHRLRHAFVGTEHLLLALTREPDGGAARLLTALLAPASADLAAVRAQTADAAGPRTGPYAGRVEDTPYTGRAKRVVELALREAEGLGHDGLGTEHLLLGLLAEGRGVAAQVLADRGVTLEAARAAVRHTGTCDALASDAAPAAPAFRVRLDDTSDRSIYEQVVAQVQEAVATGQLATGDRLPTVRQLADALDVAPGTVARAYAELERRGAVVTEGTRGTRVAPRAPVVPAAERPAALTGLLRPAVVAAYHLGATAPELRDALATAMAGIFDLPAPDLARRDDPPQAA